MQLTHDVIIDGKIRCLNKESYRVFLSEHFSTIPKGLFESTLSEMPTSGLKNARLSKRGYMRSQLDENKSLKLFQKLMQAISNDETDRAIQLLGKGAPIEKRYCVRLGKAPVERCTDGIGSQNIIFNVVEATPLLHAARRGNKTLVDKLIVFGANKRAIGKTFLFKREITEISMKLSFTSDSDNHHKAAIFTQDTRKDEKTFTLGALMV